MKTELNLFAGFCGKCKERREFTGVISTTDSGRAVAIGQCPVCESKVQRILRSAESA